MDSFISMIISIGNYSLDRTCDLHFPTDSLSFGILRSDDYQFSDSTTMLSFDCAFDFDVLRGHWSLHSRPVCVLLLRPPLRSSSWNRVPQQGD